MRKFLALLILLGVVAAGAYIYAGRLPGPAIDITNPVRFVGQSTPLDVVIDAPGAAVSSVSVDFEQNGQVTRLAERKAGETAAHVTDDGPERVRVTDVMSRDEVLQNRQRQ